MFNLTSVYSINNLLEHTLHVSFTTNLSIFDFRNIFIFSLSLALKAAPCLIT